MNFECLLNLNILFFSVLVLDKTTFGQECDSNGLKCISCSDYQKCNAGFLEEKIISCMSGASCADVLLKQCQIKLNCFDMNECIQAGIFPDPIDDSNYYVCLNDASSGFVKYSFSCPEGNFFDKSTLSCIPREATSPSPTETTTPVPTQTTSPSPTETTSPSPTETTTPVPTQTTSSSPTETTSPSPTETTSPSPTETTSPSPTETTSPSPTETTSPTPTETTTPVPTETTSPSPTETTSPSPTETTSPTPTETTSPSTSTTITSSPTTSPTPPTETPPFACSESGIFPHLSNCKMYYRCSTSLKAFLYICPGSSYFNENILKCSLIITPACQEQISKNSTSTLSPAPPITTKTTTLTPKPTTTTSTTTTETTITPKPTITSTSTVTATTTSAATTSVTSTTTIASPTTTSSNPVPPSTPISCLGTGTYTNPLDCKTYYRCSLSGKIFLYTCPGNTYFNEFTKRCSLVITPRCRNLIQG